MPDEIFDNLENYSWFHPSDVLVVRDSFGNTIAYGVKDSEDDGDGS